MDDITIEEEKNNNSNSLELKELIQRNINLSQKTLDLTVYIKKYIFFQKVFAWIKFFVILVPIVLAIVYMFPIFRSISNQFQGFDDFLKQAYSIN